RGVLREGADEALADRQIPPDREVLQWRRSARPHHQRGEHPDQEPEGERRRDRRGDRVPRDRVPLDEGGRGQEGAGEAGTAARGRDGAAMSATPRAAFAFFALTLGAALWAGCGGG